MQLLTPPTNQQPTIYFPLDDIDTQLVKDKVHHMLGELRDAKFFINTGKNVEVKTGRSFIRSLINEAQYARLNALPTWGDIVGYLPDMMDCVCEINDTPTCSRISVTYWVLWYQDGDVEAYQPTQNKGVMLTGGDLVRIEDEAEAMPHGVVRAMKITLGVSNINNTLHGFRWQLFAK